MVSSNNSTLRKLALEVLYQLTLPLSKDGKHIISNQPEIFLKKIVEFFVDNIVEFHQKEKDVNKHLSDIVINILLSVTKVNVIEHLILFICSKYENL